MRCVSDDGGASKSTRVVAGSLPYRELLRRTIGMDAIARLLQLPVQKPGDSPTLNVVERTLCTGWDIRQCCRNGQATIKEQSRARSESMHDQSRFGMARDKMADCARPASMLEDSSVVPLILYSLDFWSYESVLMLSVAEGMFVHV